uniref:7.7 kDa protein n=1 Tax=Human adenovirus 7a TaxID=85755 RepID=Q9QL92_ADE07|nr:7.7 kDa protein [Human adenovirus 7a]
MILFQSNTTNTINVQTTLNHDMAKPHYLLCKSPY